VTRASACYSEGSDLKQAASILGEGKAVPDSMVLTRQRYTFEEWIDSPENTPRCELVDGVPVERMSTSSDHGQIVGELSDWLRRAQRAGFGRAAIGPVAVVLDADGARRNVREPDACFLRQERAYLDTGRAIEGVPDLVIEVLSSGNREDDLPGGEKWRDYERFGVPVYWIVDPEARNVAQYERRDGRLVETARLVSGGVLISSLFPTITLPVDDLFANVRHGR